MAGVAQTHINMFTSLRLRPVLVSNACFVCKHVYLAASPACFGIKFMFRLQACLPSCVSGLCWYQIHVSSAGMVGVLAARRTAKRSTDRCVRLLPVLACLLSDMFNSFLLLASFISSHICGQVVVFVVVATTGRAQLPLEQHCATQT